MSDQPWRIVVIDDDVAIRRVLEMGLRARGYRATVAATGEEGLGAVAVEDPDVVVLDLGLPDLDGVEVCRQIRTWSDVPIIVLSAHGAEDRKIEALDEGADDFVTKPFSMRELLARIRVALRHRQRLERSAADEDDHTAIEIGDLVIDRTAHRVTVAGGEVELTSKEYAIVEYLARNAGRVITHDALLAAVWGPGYTDEVHYLRVYVSRLRRKLESDPDHPRLLVTLPRVGYRLELPDHA